MAIIDVVTYNGEKELFDIRFNILKDNVDEFIVVEAPLTFTGKPKPLYFKEIQDKYPDVKYYVVDENDSELWEMARQSPNTIGAEHWKREFVHKESIKKALTHLNDDDICVIGDCDEIWIKSALQELGKKLKLRVYAYKLNNRSDEQFWGSIVYKYKDIKNACLNHLRTDSPKTEFYYGWHFTNMGGVEETRRKLNDSYTDESYNTEVTQAYLKARVEENRDYLGRAFKFHKENETVPEYILLNLHKYKDLWIEN